MFKFILLMLLSFSTMADVEVSIGRTQFGVQENGYWYQDGFSHDLNMTSNSFSIGLTDKFLDSYRYHIGYKYLGHVSTIAWCMGDDALYAQFQKTGVNPLKLGLFTGDGSVNMLYFTAGPEFQFGQYTLGLEAGLTVYRPTWTEQGIGFQKVPNGPLYDHEWTSNPKIMTGGTIGASIGYHNVEAVLSLYDINSGQAVWSVYHGIASNLSIRYHF